MKKFVFALVVACLSAVGATSTASAAIHPFTCTKGSIVKNVHRHRVATLQGRGFTCVPTGCPGKNEINVACPVGTSDATEDDVDHDWMCRIVDGNEQAQAVDTNDPIYDAWVAAFAHYGNVDGGNNVGQFHMNCMPGEATGLWTDDTGSVMNAANTDHANQIVKG